MDSEKITVKELLTTTPAALLLTFGLLAFAQTSLACDEGAGSATASAAEPDKKAKRGDVAGRTGSSGKSGKGLRRDASKSEPSVSQGNEKSLAVKKAAKADAAKKDAPVRSTRPNASRATPARLSPTEISAALGFAKEHHPELARLLEKLRKQSSPEFNRGIREVHVAAVRLERYREKQPARFEAGIRDWKRDSEIRLLSAKWIVSGDSKLEKRIQQLLRQRMEQRIESMKSERERLSARLDQLDEQINMDTAEMDAALAAEWERLSKRRNAASKLKRSGRPPARKTDKDKKTE